MKIALYQPEIAQNAGTLLRLGACLGIDVDVIEPCGFIWNDRKLHRAGMDYLDQVVLTRHPSWDSFLDHYNLLTPQPDHRLVLIDTRATVSFMDFTFEPQDVLLLGKESSGVPESVFNQIQNRVVIPMLPQRRSLNVAIAGAMVLTEALRQVNGWNSAIKV